MGRRGWVLGSLTRLDGTPGIHHKIYVTPAALLPTLQARTRLSQRPWRVDDFDAFAEVWFSKSQLDADGQGKQASKPIVYMHWFGCKAWMSAAMCTTFVQRALQPPPSRMRSLLRSLPQFPATLPTHCLSCHTCHSPLLPPSPPAGKVVSPYQRAIMFVDNAGADVVLGMIPFARELLRMGAEVRGAGAGRRWDGLGA